MRFFNYVRPPIEEKPKVAKKNKAAEDLDEADAVVLAGGDAVKKPRRSTKKAPIEAVEDNPVPKVSAKRPGRQVSAAQEVRGLTKGTHSK